MTKLDRRRASTLVAVLADRIADLCASAGRDDLLRGVYLLEELARANPDAMRSKRADVISILADDDQHVALGDDIREYMIDVARAFEEQATATLQ